MVTETRNEVGGAGMFLFRRGRRPAAERRCPSCGEELSDGFGFCPVDGTPLGITAKQKPQAVKERNGHPQRVTGREEFRLTVIEHRVLPVRLLAALVGAVRVRPGAEPSAGQTPSHCSDAQTATKAAGQTGERPEEMRFAMMEDVGLLRRLAQELGAFAQDSQLTWPELRRDPAGFVRRAFDALDKLGLIPFSRRYKTTSSPTRRTDDLSGVS